MTSPNEFRLLVEEYFPEASDEYIEYILWEHTAYPFGSIDDCRKCLEDLVNPKAKDDVSIDDYKNMM